MTRTELESHLASTGWSKDRFGHFHRGEFRMKMQDKSVRLESVIRHEDGTKGWFRKRTGYFGQMSINNGKILGMK